METDYKKIFSGDTMVGQRIVAGLHQIGIEAILKDEAESARLAGFATSAMGQVDVFVHKDEVERAGKVVTTIQEDSVG